MDELDQLRAARPAAEPTPPTVERHRAALDAAIVSQGRSRLGPGRRALVAVAAAAAAVTIVSVVVAAGREDDVVVAASDATTTTGTVAATTAVPTTAPLPAFTCGAELPVDLPAPPGASGPFPGPAPGTLDPVVPGQLVLHWVAPDFSYELRWPSPRTDEVEASMPSGDLRVDESFVEADGSTSGAQNVDTWSSKLPAGCSVVRVTTFGGVEPSATIDAGFVMRRQMERPWRLGPSTDLIVGVRDAIALPEPVGCSGNGSTVGGGRQDGAFADEAAALRAFLDGQPTVASSPYEELVLADGTRALVWSVQPGVPIVVLHLAPPADAGGVWSVLGWEASGC